MTSDIVLETKIAPEVDAKEQLEKYINSIVQGLAIEADFSLPSERVVRTLEQIIEWRGAPR